MIVLLRYFVFMVDSHHQSILWTTSEHSIDFKKFLMRYFIIFQYHRYRVLTGHFRFLQYHTVQYTAVF